jgi:hypothetical protein
MCVRFTLFIWFVHSMTLIHRSCWYRFCYTKVPPGGWLHQTINFEAAVSITHNTVSNYHFAQHGE